MTTPPFTIPEFKLVAEPVDKQAKDMTISPWSGEEVGCRHKIGGRPDLLQADPWPTCPSCGEPTVFYGQLDSLGDKDGLYDVADVGMIFVFFCFDCNEARTLVQSG